MPDEVTALAPALAPISEESALAALPAPTPSTRPSHRPFEPLRNLRNHRLAASVAFVVTALSLGYYLRDRLGPLYKAESIVYVSPTTPTELADDAHYRDDQFFEQQVYAVTRPDNIKRAVEANRSFWMLPGESEQNAISRLQKALKVEQMGHSYQLSISLQSKKRDGLAELVNSVTSEYLVTAHNDEFFDRDQQIDVLRRQKQQLSEELDTDLTRQGALLASLGIVQIDEKGTNNPYETQLDALRKQLVDAHEKRDEADAQFNAMSDSALPNKVTGSDAPIPSTVDPGLSAMETQLSAKRANLMLQMAGLTPQNPLYVQSQSEIDAIDQQTKVIEKEAAEKASSQLKRRYGSERLRASSLESQIIRDLSQTQAMAATVTPKFQQAMQLNADITRLQANSALIDNRINSLSLERNAPGSEHIVSVALPSSEDAPKRILLFVGALLFSGLLVAVVLAFTLDALDPNVYTSDEIYRLIGFSPMALLLSQKEFPEPISQEYMLRLASGIDQAHRKTGARTFLFTSAGSGDTRDLVRSVGTELATSGLTTLVILVGEHQPPPHDPPLRWVGHIEAEAEYAATPQRATQNRAEVLAERRFRELIEGRDVRHETAQLTMDSETFIGSCKIVTKPPQVLAEFLRKARTSYETVLIGADPLLISANSEHLARMVDGAIVVTESGEVTKRQLTRVARLLERLKVSGIAVVLSEITKQRADRDVLDNVAEYAQRGLI